MFSWHTSGDLKLVQTLQEEFGSHIQLLILVCSGRKRVHFEWMPEGQYSMRLSCPEECFGCYFFSRQRHTQLRNALQELLCFSLEQPSPQYGKCSGSLPSKLKSETRSHWMRAVQKMLRLVDAIVFAHSPVPNILHSMKQTSGFHAVCLHFPELWIFYARLECIILLHHTGSNVDHVVWLTLALFARDKGDKHTIQKKSVDTSSI